GHPVCALWLLFQVSSISNCAAGLNLDVERQRLVSGGPNLDAVRPRLEAERLEDAVEVVHVAGEVPIDRHRRIVRRHLEMDAAVRIVPATIPITGAISTVPVTGAISAVIARIAISIA